MTHTGRGIGNAHSCALSKYVEVLPRPRGGSGAERPEIHATDGRHGSTECQVTQRHRSKGMERTMQNVPMKRGIATGRRSHSKDTDTPEVHRVRQGRLPRSPRAPIVADVERHCTNDRPTLRPGRPVSDILECGGDPHHSGEESRSKDESVRTRPCVVLKCVLSPSRTLGAAGPTRPEIPPLAVPVAPRRPKAPSIQWP
jgi:hypothetical protein